MKSNEKLGLCVKDENHFTSSFFILETTRLAGGFHIHGFGCMKTAYQIKISNAII